MCTESQHKEKIDLLQQLVGNPPIDGTYQISSTRPYSLDYKERKYIYLWSTNDLTLSLEELGTLPVAAGSWINLSLSPGMRIFALNQTAPVPIFIRCCDDQIDPGQPTSSPPSIQQYVRDGQAFFANAGLFAGGTNCSGPNTFYGSSLFNPANSGKNILVYTCIPQVTGSVLYVDLVQQVVNPTLDSNATIFNAKQGGPSSALVAGSVTFNGAASGMSFATAYPGGIVILGSYNVAQDVQQNILRDSPVLLPSGSAFGLEVIFAMGAQKYTCIWKWIEY